MVQCKGRAVLEQGDDLGVILEWPRMLDCKHRCDLHSAISGTFLKLPEHLKHVYRMVRRYARTVEEMSSV